MDANDGGSKKPMRRLGARGRQEPRRDSMKAPGKMREDDEKNWTKKFEEGELDDLLVTGEEDGDDDPSTWFDAAANDADSDEDEG